MAKAKHWTGIARLGFATAALIAASVPAVPSLAQQPAAAAPAAAAPADDPRIAKGRDMFSSWGCTSCHALADAQSHGDVGPHLDGAGLTEAFIVNRVTNGQGAMPAFGGQLTEQEIADLAYYIAKVAKK